MHCSFETVVVKLTGIIYVLYYSKFAKDHCSIQAYFRTYIYCNEDSRNNTSQL